MPNQFHQFLDIIQNEWPKALLGAVIPAATQFGWKLWKDRQVETKKNLLREKIRDLAQFLQVPLPDAPDAAKLKSDAAKEYAEAVARLAQITALDKKAATAITSRVPQAPLLRLGLRCAKHSLAQQGHAIGFYAYVSSVTLAPPTTSQSVRTSNSPRTYCS